MAAFVVNGTPVTVEKNQKLIRYLRDELHLTSVKDGCSEGAMQMPPSVRRRVLEWVDVLLIRDSS